MKKTLILLSSLCLLIIAGSVVASSYENHSAEQKLYGTVEHIPQGGYGIWVVDGKQVLVTEQTRFENEYGRPTVGSLVEIEGNTNGKEFRAYEIENKSRGSQTGNEYNSKYRHNDSDEDDRGEYSGKGSGSDEFYGRIEKIPAGSLGTWLISGREVFVDRSTRIKAEHGPAAIGSSVEVEGHTLQGSGAFYARKIETK